MLQFRVEGSGPPLLLIHGFGVTYSIWRNLRPLLRSHFQLVMIELPGIGRSPDCEPEKPYYEACSDSIEEVRRGLGIEQWAILAYSSGTRAGEAYAQRNPQRVTRAAFLCPLYMSAWASVGLRVAWWLDNARPTLADWALSDWRAYGLVVALGFNGHRHAYARMWAHEICHQSVGCLKRSMWELPRRGRSPFSVPGVPTLFIWGRRDALTTHPRRPRPNDIVISANHSAPMLASTRIAEVVIPFLAEGRLPVRARRTRSRRTRSWRVHGRAALARVRRQIGLKRPIHRRGVVSVFISSARRMRGPGRVPTLALRRQRSRRN